MGEVRQATEQYQREMAMYEEIVLDAMHGTGGTLTRAERRIREAMSLPEFDSYFGDILDRQVVSRFQMWEPSITQVASIGTFRDLSRNKRRSQFRGGNGALAPVQELSEYPERGQTLVDFTWSGQKYGADFQWSWELALSDDLNGLSDLPDVLASAARHSEGRFITELYVDSSGPHASLYSVANGNLGTAALSITALENAYAAMISQVDPGDASVPMQAIPAFLVVPPQLALTARKILASELQQQQGSATPVPTRNIVSDLPLTLVVDPNIPLVASYANGETSWFLFANPNASSLGPGLPAIAFDRLMGMEAPLLLRKRGQFESLAGGADPRGALSANDATAIRVVHAFGGARMHPQATYGSTP
jgi:hypothetical protein